MSLQSTTFRTGGSRVVLGELHLLVGGEHEATVVLDRKGEQPQQQRRYRPSLLPRRGRTPLGRERDLRAITAAITTGGPVQLYGPQGIGKSTLLRFLAHSFADSGQDVVYLDAGDRDVDDVLQDLFEACYDSSEYLPARAELSRLMAGVSVRVFLDDLDCSAKELQELGKAAPDADLVFTSTSQGPHGARSAFELAGLPREVAFELLTQELGRPLRADEGAAAERLWQASGGRPLQLLRAAAAARTAVGGVVRLPDAQASDALMPALLSELGPSERAVLALFATFPDARVAAPLLADLSGEADAAALSQRLATLGLLVDTPGGYRLAAGVVEHLPDEARLGPAAIERAAILMTAWVAASPPAVVGAHTTLLTALVNAASQAHPGIAVQLARAAAPMVARSVRPGGWQRVLDAGLAVARKAHDRAAQAYFQHETGIRALGLGKPAAAAAAFTAAAALWHQLGDATGTSITLDAQALAEPSGASVTRADISADPPGTPATDPGTAVVGPGTAAVGPGGVGAGAGAGAVATGAGTFMTATVAKIAAVCVIVPSAAYGVNEYVAPCLLTNATNSPATVLAEAVNTLDNTTVRFSGNLGTIQMQGVSDPHHQAMQATMSVGGEQLEMRAIGNDLYLTGISGGAGAQWYHFALDQLGVGNPYASASKPASSAAFLNAVADGDGSATCTYRGQVDLALLAEQDPEQRDQAQAYIAELGPGALQVPFEAELDNHERLTSVTTTLPFSESGGEDLQVTGKYWDYGTDAQIEAPSGNVVEAPPEAYLLPGS
jgi:energy-coupling factor transporter ATP-binding protein EcfA2